MPENIGTRSLEDMRLTTNGVMLHAVAAGPNDGPLVILLHGFPEFWYGWRRQIEPLAAAGFRVLVPDQRGYNISSKPEDLRAYTLDVVADDVLGLAAAFGRFRFAVVDTTGVGLWRGTLQPETPTGLSVPSSSMDLTLRQREAMPCPIPARCSKAGTSACFRCTARGL